MDGLPDSRDILLIRSGTVAGSYLIIDLTKTPPELVSAEEVIPAAILQVLKDIQANQEKIMAGMAAEQAQINDLATAISAVADHVSSATAGLAQWIADHQGTVDLGGAMAALGSLQAADSGLSAIVPQAPAAPLPDPIPDPGPPSPELPAPQPDPVPVDPALTIPPDSGSTPDVPPDAPLPS